MTKEVLAVIKGERLYQETKYPGHTHTVAEWLLILEGICAAARAEWVKNRGDAAALHEVRKLTATGMACLEMCGAPKRGEPINTSRPVQQPQLPLGGEA